MCGTVAYALRNDLQTKAIKAALTSVINNDAVEFRMEVSSTVFRLLLPSVTLFAISGQLHDLDAKQAIAFLLGVLGITVRAEGFTVPWSLFFFRFFSARQRSALLR